MKVKLWKGAEGLNPMPVMGKDAFVAFAQEWTKLLRDRKREGQIILPTLSRFRENMYDDFSKLYIEGSHFEGINLSGYCGNPYHPNPHIYFYFSSKHSGISAQNNQGCDFSTDVINDFELSNIIFNKLPIPSSEDKSDVADILRLTRKMIYERSALVSRGLLGGYYIS